MKNETSSAHLQKGIVQIYWGNGKGKTTAAIGQAVRAIGQGLSIYFVQFLKPKDLFSGEIAVFNTFKGQCIVKRPNSLSLLTNDRSLELIDNEKAQIIKEIDTALEHIKIPSYDIFIFDEIITAMNIKVIKEEDIFKILDTKLPQTEIILTGLQPSLGLSNRADLITEMKLHKHPYQSGLQARRGIEY